MVRKPKKGKEIYPSRLEPSNVRKTRYVRKRKRPSLRRNISLTWILIFINVIIFIPAFIIIISNEAAIGYIAITPEDFINGRNLWTVLTSVFMHGGIFHLFVNMFTLFYLGHLVETIIGRRRYLWFYLAAGVLASLAFVAFAYLGQFIPRGANLFGAITDSGVGASGAIFGLVGILAVLIPKKHVYLIAGPIIVIVLQFLIRSIVPETYVGTVDLIATLLVFFSLFAIFSGNKTLTKFAVPVQLKFWQVAIVAIVPLVIVSFFVKLPIGNSAHFGGLLVGLAYGYYLRKKYPKKVKLLNRILKF